MNHEQEKYYVPEQSPWPIVGAFALFFIAVGAGLTIIQLKSTSNSGVMLLLVGIAVLIYMIFGWFRNVIQESQNGLYSAKWIVRSSKEWDGLSFPRLCFLLLFLVHFSMHE